MTTADQAFAPARRRLPAMARHACLAALVALGGCSVSYLRNRQDIQPPPDPLAAPNCYPHVPVRSETSDIVVGVLQVTTLAQDTLPKSRVGSTRFDEGRARSLRGSLAAGLGHAIVRRRSSSCRHRRMRLVINVAALRSLFSEASRASRVVMTSDGIGSRLGDAAGTTKIVSTQGPVCNAACIGAARDASMANLRPCAAGRTIRWAPCENLDGRATEPRHQHACCLGLRASHAASGYPGTSRRVRRHRGGTKVPSSSSRCSIDGKATASTCRPIRRISRRRIRRSRQSPHSRSPCWAACGSARNRTAGRSTPRWSSRWSTSSAAWRCPCRAAASTMTA